MKIKKSNYKPAKQHTILTTGEVIKMLRELKGWTQEELSKYCSINSKKSLLSFLENRQSIDPRMYPNWKSPISCSLN